MTVFGYVKINIPSAEQQPCPVCVDSSDGHQCMMEGCVGGIIKYKMRRASATAIQDADDKKGNPFGD